MDLDGDTELWRISARVGALNDVDYGEFKNDIRARVEPVLQAERERLAKKAAKKAASRNAQADRQAAAGESAPPTRRRRRSKPDDDMGI